MFLLSDLQLWQLVFTGSIGTPADPGCYISQATRLGCHVVNFCDRLVDVDSRYFSSGARTEMV